MGAVVCIQTFTMVIVLILCVLAPTVTYSFHLPTRDQSKCLTKSGREGECIVISKCDEIVQTIRDKKNKEKISLLEDIACGYENQAPKVCCDLKSSVDQQSKESADREEKSTTPSNVVSDEFDLELRNGFETRISEDNGEACINCEFP